MKILLFLLSLSFLSSCSLHIWSKDYNKCYQYCKAQNKCVEDTFAGRCLCKDEERDDDEEYVYEDKYEVDYNY